MEHQIEFRRRSREHQILTYLAFSVETASTSHLVTHHLAFVYTHYFRYYCFSFPFAAAFTFAFSIAIALTINFCDKQQ